MQNLLSLTEIFEGRVFRIPDYQRGYSWKRKHLEAFWDDLENLQDGHIHYTGVITVERPTHQQCLNWQREGEAFSERYWRQNGGFSELSFGGRTVHPFYVVDGQQRLLTIATLLATMTECEALPQVERDELKSQFLLNEKDGQQCYLFGYEVDLPSHWYLIQRIYQNLPESKEIETAYTDNLFEAKQFFAERLADLSANELRLLRKKVTASVQFNYYEVDKKLDVFVVFETMNNRGKILSKLELLKNRLLYLSTLLPEEDRPTLRQRINACWKLIHEWLAKARDRVLDDDEFLRIHWIMYFDHINDKQPQFQRGDPNERELGSFSEHLLDQWFIVKRIHSGELSAKDILAYVDNLGLSVERWFALNFPRHSKSSLSEPMRDWMERINALRPQSLFRPIILALLQKNFSDEEKVQLLRKIERHEFLVFALVKSRANANRPYFYRQANRLFVGQLQMESLIDDIRKKAGKFYTQDKFKEYVDKLFDEGSGDDRGYPEWPHLKFFLFEYENHLREQRSGEALAQRDTCDFERIYPKRIERDPSWHQDFDDIYSDDKCRKLCNSLGNLVLLSRPKKPQEMQFSSFEEKKRHPRQGNPDAETGYFSGSYSEREAAAFEFWRHKEIFERGIKMLNFMSERWEISLESKKLTLTQVNFEAEESESD